MKPETPDVHDPEGPAAEALTEGMEASPAAERLAAHTAAADALQPRDEIDYKDRWLRAEAEMQNLRRRSARESEDVRRSAEERVLADVLGVLDDLDRALATLEGEQATQAWAQGVALVAQRLRDMLARHGVVAIESAGTAFDPTRHDALMEVEAPEGVAAGTVVQEVEKGYRRGDRVLRAARVVVARTAEH